MLIQAFYLNVCLKQQFQISFVPLLGTWSHGVITLYSVLLRTIRLNLVQQTPMNNPSTTGSQKLGQKNVACWWVTLCLFEVSSIDHTWDKMKKKNIKYFLFLETFWNFDLLGRDF